MVAELQRALTELGLEQYLANCLGAGIQNWQSLTTITEAELVALGVRIGHRRKLQRAIARGYLWPDNRPLPTPEQLQQHRQNLRRLARGNIDPEILEESYYAVASSAQSPWSRETAASPDTDGSGERIQDGTSHRATDVLRTSSRLFPLTLYADKGKTSKQEKISRVLRSLDSFGLKISAYVDSEEKSSLDIIIPYGPNQGSSSRSPFCESQAIACSQPLETFFKAFLQSFNHFLFLFSESELRQYSVLCERTSDADLPIDIYLILALGAKASVFQVEDVQNDWYTRARLRLLSEEYNNNLWIMRILTLICIFEIDDDADIACRFLDAALSIGLANGFDSQQPIVNEMDEPLITQWLRVWETIRFLNLWFQHLRIGAKQLSNTGPFLNIDQPPLLSYHCYNGRLVQMSISSISNYFRKLKDRREIVQHSSSRLYEIHLSALDRWQATLPLYIRLQTPTSESHCIVHQGASYEQKTAILNVQTLFLGLVCDLLQPALINFLQDRSSASENYLTLHARRCVHSATILVRLCDEIIASNYPLSASWIAQHFLFNAALILIVDTSGTDSALEELVSPKERFACIQIAQKLINQVSSTSPQAAIIDTFCRATRVPNTTSTKEMISLES